MQPASKLHDGALLALLRYYGSSMTCPHAQRRLWSRPKLLLGRASSTFAVTSDGLRHCRRRETRNSLAGSSRSNATTRHYATAPPPAPDQREIAVLGGGLTGLTTAYYLTKFLPKAKITLYESSRRLGGWIDTEKVEVGSKAGSSGHTLFERGARSIMPQTNKFDDLVLYELIEDLDLARATYGLHKGPDVATQRYIYYPDHLVNVTAPVMSLKDPLGSLLSIAGFGWMAATEPVFTGLARAMSTKYLNTSRHGDQPGDMTDESIGDFFAKELGGRHMVDNLLSAIIHGIYGGDVWKLSVESSIFRLYRWKAHLFHPRTGIPKKAGSTLVTMNDLCLARDLLMKSAKFRRLVAHSSNHSLLWFNGFSSLTDALTNNLRQNSMVQIRVADPVTDVQYEHSSGKVKVVSAKSPMGISYDKVISSLLSKTLYKITANKLLALRNERAVTIQVVNLFYPKPNLNSPHNGFGYLIPSSVPSHNNPEAALGVLFDSDRESIQPPARDSKGNEIPSVPGTKFTVMLGGHHWDEMEWMIPSPDDAASMAKAVVSRHLGIPESEHAFASTKLCRDCIPQHLVGHGSRMAQADKQLLQAFKGKLAVVGGSYTAQGVLSGVRAARDMALQVAGRGYRLDEHSFRSMAHVGDTGLAKFTDTWTDEIMSVSKSGLPQRDGIDEVAWLPNVIRKAQSTKLHVPV